MQTLKQQCLARDPAFWNSLRAALSLPHDPSDLLTLLTLRKKAVAAGIPRPSAESVRVAVLGGVTLYPLVDWTLLQLDGHNIAATSHTGAFDDYRASSLSDDPALLALRPDVIALLPSPQEALSQLAVGEAPARYREAAEKAARSILDTCDRLHSRYGSQILLSNFPLPVEKDWGAFRAKHLGSDWSYRKLLNLSLGELAPSFVHLCDTEYLAYRRGFSSASPKDWFEAKQLGSYGLVADVASELASLIARLRAPTRKVLVLDLDNTLWGGTIGDAGVSGIEVGPFPARAEAFLAFQRYAKSLKERGWLLAVCSKNELANAEQPFLEHPEMALRLEDFASFQANWDPKPENLKRIASDLGLSVDSLVFVDDSAAEIEMVRQFLPEVATILLTDDPSHHVTQLKESGHFECLRLTAEDKDRAAQYHTEKKRAELAQSAGSLDDFLESLQMRATLGSFRQDDVTRIAQLVNKSNQFNLTTFRRSEAEIRVVANDSSYLTISCRLRDKLGDHGLISVVIGKRDKDTLLIDTWLMSCRVLQRQVELALLTRLVAQCQSLGIGKIFGVYRPSSKNGMVKDHYTRLGFRPHSTDDKSATFVLELKDFIPPAHRITIEEESHEGNDRRGDSRATATGV